MDRVETGHVGSVAVTLQLRGVAEVQEHLSVSDHDYGSRTVKPESGRLEVAAPLLGRVQLGEPGRPEREPLDERRERHRRVDADAEQELEDVLVDDADEHRLARRRAPRRAARAR